MASTGSPAVATAPEQALRERRVRAFLEEAGDLTAFAGRSLRALAGTPRYFSEVLRHAAILIRGTTLLLFVMTAFIGTAVINFTYFFLRVIGASDYTGLGPALGIPRIGAIVMFGYVFAAKVGCGITAELGAAKVNEELDAYESEAVDPYRYVVGTRIAAALIYIPIAAAVALVGGFLGSYFTAVIVLEGLSPMAFSSVAWSLQSPMDQVYMLITVAAIAVAIVVVACFYGYRTSGGPAGVGDAVARSVTVNLVLLHVIAAFFAIVFYGTDARVPFGG